MLREHIRSIPDTRQAEKSTYELPDCYLSGFALFFLQDPSLLEFQRRFQNRVQRNNLSTVFGVREIPADSQFRELIDTHDYQPLYGVFRDYFRGLQRGKHLKGYRFLGQYYLVSMDGTEYFGSEKIGCRKCLRKKSGDGTLRFYHQVLQATLVAPGKRQVIPLAPEFVSNRSMEQGVQDCELEAGKRLVPKLRQAHRQLPMVLTADGLYSKQSFIRVAKQQRMSFILAAKPKDHRSLMEDIEGLRRGGYLSRLQYSVNKNKHYLYEWVNAVPLNGEPGSEEVNFIEFHIFNAQGKRTYHNSWVTDIQVDEHNVRELVRGGRARWKIENEGFNTLKNHGYHLEHNFGHGGENLSEAFFVLNLLAFLVHQILALTDRLYQSCRAGFSSRKEFWNAIRASFRLLLFDSWEQVLTRMNSPPLPAFQG